MSKSSSLLLPSIRTTHFAVKSCKKVLKSYDFKTFRWSEWRDLNSRPHGPEPCALPTALHPDMKFYGFAPQNSSIIRASFRSVKGRIHFFQKAPQSAGCGALAGACEDRTHLRGSSPLSPVLKTGGHTSTHLLPYRGRRAPSRFFTALQNARPLFGHHPHGAGSPAGRSIPAAAARDRARCRAHRETPPVPAYRAF